VVGVIGVTAALVILAPLVRRALSRRDRAVVAVLAGGVAALGVRALIDYDLHVGQTACLFALVVGALVTEGSDVDVAAAVDVDVDVDGGAVRAARRSLLMGSGAAAVLVLLLAWRDAAGRGSLLERVDVGVALRHAVRAPDPAERVRLLAPFAEASPVAAVIAARAALDAGDAEAARAFAVQALRRDPHAEVARQLLQSTSSMGDPPSSSSSSPPPPPP
jgi:hypothetical protein